MRRRCLLRASGLQAGPLGHRIDHVIDERGIEVCRIDGMFFRTERWCLSGKLAHSLAVEMTRFETGAGPSLVMSGV